jgi:hypothetical protein
VRSASAAGGFFFIELSISTGSLILRKPNDVVGYTR